jgi:hypothetical protein
LAEGRVAVRNVDGALHEAPGVVFAHADGDPWGDESAKRLGRAAAARARLVARANPRLVVLPQGKGGPH